MMARVPIILVSSEFWSRVTVVETAEEVIAAFENFYDNKSGRRHA